MFSNDIIAQGHNPFTDPNPTKPQKKLVRDTIYISQIYMDVDKMILRDSIFIYKGKNQDDLMNHFQNWAGDSFMNFENVKTNQSKNQFHINLKDDYYYYFV